MSAPSFNEDQALAFLHRRDLSAEMLTGLARNPEALKSRKVLLALISHQRTPRHLAIPLLRRIFTFDLMQVSLTPVIAADIKRAAEEQIVLRLETLSIGEKITLAKRASGRVAAALLQDADARVIGPALENAQLTEPLVVEALMKPRAPAVLFELVSEHRNWSQRREVQRALLRSEKTPLDKAVKFAEGVPISVLREIAPQSRVDLLQSAARPVSHDAPEISHSNSGDPK